LATLADTVVSDAELVALMANGDEGALRELFERHGGVVLALARRMLSNSEDAEEVLHDTYLSLWRHAAHYDGTRAAVRTYLYAVARNHCLTRLRARSARPLVRDVEPEALEGMAYSSYQDPIPGVMARRALSALVDEDRRLLEEAYFGGWSQSELADRHDLPLGTVKSRVRRALLKMRDVLEGRS
jgi:RNA polymerase sigma-70 factor (ECF subfamily)